jgi:hypothetical protein
MAFVITQHKGIQIKLANGIILSVQWGPGNYSSHHGSVDFHAPQKADFWESETAEIALWKGERGGVGEMIRIGYDTVQGYVSADNVVKILAVLQELPADATEEVIGKAVCKVLDIEQDNEEGN